MQREHSKWEALHHARIRAERRAAMLSGLYAAAEMTSLSPFQAAADQEALQAECRRFRRRYGYDMNAHIVDGGK